LTGRRRRRNGIIAVARNKNSGSKNEKCKYTDDPFACRRSMNARFPHSLTFLMVNTKLAGNRDSRQAKNPVLPYVISV
jgi:hypothetical protein